MATELKRCPFCGSAAKRLKVGRFGYTGEDMAKCSLLYDCAGGKLCVTVAQWNVRAPTPEGEALRGLLKAMDLALGKQWRDDHLVQGPETNAVDDAWEAVLALDPEWGEDGEAHGIQLPAVEEGNDD